MVVANAINALSEIRDMNTNENLEILAFNRVINSLLLCLNECTEWGESPF